jgi:hypothetical protein
MTLHVSATMLVITVIAMAAGVWVHRWSQERTTLGVPQKRGDLIQAVGTAVTTAAALVALLGVSDSSVSAERQTVTPAVGTHPTCSSHP